MDILHKDRLQEELEKSKLTNRELVWLLLYLRNDGMKFDPDAFGAADMCDAMADYIYEHRLGREVQTAMSMSFLPESNFDWIDKSRRQARWLLYEILQEKHIETPSCPAHLSAKEELIALIDFADIPLDRKSAYLKRLQRRWGHHKANDKRFDWFTKGDARQKCEAAWQWYYDKHPRVVDEVSAFKSADDILFALDCSRFTVEEVEYHVAQIKKKLKAKQVAERREGKPQTNLTLEAEDREALKKLAKQEGKTMTEIVRWLIQAASQQGMPARPLASQNKP